MTRFRRWGLTPIAADAMRAGKRTVIVATSGIEMNGPYLAPGKHNVVLRATTPAIARRLGDALVAPIVAFVPEGSTEPPSGHMRSWSACCSPTGQPHSLIIAEAR